MTPLDLTNALKKYTTGWIALDEKNLKVVAHSKDFVSLSKRVQNKKNVVLMPASDNYFGLVT